MQLFFAPDVSENLHTLPESESKHLIRVLRKKVDDEIHLTDGMGNLYRMRIQDANPKRCVLNFLSKDFHANQLKRDIHVAISPIKSSDRMEWFVEKATEVGISSITPILCDRSERKKINVDRLEKVVISAMKQSNRFHLPTVHPMHLLEDFIQKDSSDNKLVAHCLPDNRKELHQLQLGSSVSILIGPEGDFHPTEIEKAIQHGYQPVSLGSARLRTETAGIVACNFLNFL